jgi:hypothetical protein
MTDQPSSSSIASPWQASDEELAELLRLHREQLLLYEDLPAEPGEGARAAASPKKLTLDDVDEDLRELVARYEESRPGVKLTPLRCVTIGGPEGTTVVGSAELPADGLVSLVVTQTIASEERAEVTSRILVARAAKSGKRAS